MKRLLSLLLCLALAFSLMPAAFAEADEGDNASDGTQLIDETIIVEPASENEEGEPAAPDEPTDAPEEPDGGEEAVPSAEENNDDDREVSASASWVNPLYESAGFSACDEIPEDENVPRFFSFARYEANYYITVDSAAAYVRAQMVARSTEITVNYTISDRAYLSGNESVRMDYIRGTSTTVGLYKQIMDAAMAHTGKATEGDSLLFVIPGYTCNLNYSTGATNGNVKFVYTICANVSPTSLPADNFYWEGYYTNAQQESALTAEINSIISGLNLTGKSDFEKTRAVYAYICDNVAYDHSGYDPNNKQGYFLKYTAYGAVKNHTAVCQGIAVMFYRLMLELGVDSRVVGSDAVQHAWNIVKLNNKYYYLDATWDETKTQNTWIWFLRCPANFDLTRHPVDGDYAAASFVAAYPMSTTDYIGSKTLTLDFSGFDLGRTDGAIYIDGVPYIPTASTITLPDVTSKTAVLYYFNNTAATDRHTVYPQNMYVWTLNYQDGAYSATRMSAFDNILQYAGSSMRLTGTKGVRMISSVPKNMKLALTSAAGFNGYTLLEYGTRAAWANTLGSAPLVNGGANVFGNHAYKKSTGEDPVFKTTDSVIQFTNALTFTDISKCAPDLALRPYMILQDPNGVHITLYGGIIYRNIGYMAYQNRATFTAGTDAYNYIWSIINYVYPNGYTAA